jgi:hypothetical protein
MWPNDGQGGFICERSIIWAKDTPPSEATVPSDTTGCVLVTSAAYATNDQDNYWFYTGSELLPPTAIGFLDADCTVTNGEPTGAWSLVTADASVGAAACQVILGIDGGRWPYGDPRVWVCF